MDTESAALEVADRIDEISMQISHAARRQDDAGVARLLAERDAAHAQMAQLHQASQEAQEAMHDPILLRWYPEVDPAERHREVSSTKGVTGSMMAGGAKGRVSYTTQLSAFETIGEVVQSPGRHACRAKPKAHGDELLLTTLELPRSAEFEHAQVRAARVCDAAARRGAPVLSALIPSTIFYDAEHPTRTYLLTSYSDYADGTMAFADWMSDMRGRLDALLPPPPLIAAPSATPTVSPLAAVLAPLFLAVAELHRHGLAHVAITPHAIRVREGGSVALADLGFPTSGGGGGGAYDAPEIAHNAEAHAHAAFSADGWSLGAMLIELLTGSPPQWNQSRRTLEDGRTSQPLRVPRPLPAGRLGYAWALAAALTAEDPTARLSVDAALRSPLFTPLSHTDALSPIAASSLPPPLHTSTGAPMPLDGAPPVPMTSAMPAVPSPLTLATPLAIPLTTPLTEPIDLLNAPPHNTPSAIPFSSPLTAHHLSTPVMDALPLAVPLPPDAIDDDPPDWPTAAAVDIGVDPTVAILPESPPPAVAAWPIVEVLVSGDADAGADADADAALIAAVLDAAPSLVRECELRFTLATDTSVESRPPSELIHRFFTAVTHEHLPHEMRLFEHADGGTTFLPAPSPPTASVPPAKAVDVADDSLLVADPFPSSAGATADDAAHMERLRAVGQLLGYCALHELHVPIPLPAVLFCALTGRTGACGGGSTHPPPLPRDINTAVALLGGFAPQSAIALRCQLAKRAGGGAAGKSARALAEVHRELISTRAGGLEAMRVGLASIVGADPLAALAPAELACRVLGGLHVAVGGAAVGVHGVHEAFTFDPVDWEEEQLRNAYEQWFATWLHALTPPQRVAFELLAFGAAVGAPRGQRTCCVPSAEAAAIFLPESHLLSLPTAGSQEELAARMAASIALAF